jgi:hypothetical protein
MLPYYTDYYSQKPRAVTLEENIPFSCHCVSLMHTGLLNAVQVLQ